MFPVNMTFLIKLAWYNQYLFITGDPDDLVLLQQSLSSQSAEEAHRFIFFTD